MESAQQFIRFEPWTAEENENYNHDLKNLFKGAAVVASTKPGPFEKFYAALVAKYTPRNGAADLSEKDCHDCFDCVEERGVLRRQSSETTNSLSVSDRVRSILGIFSGGGLWVLETPWFESESQLIC